MSDSKTGTIGNFSNDVMTLEKLEKLIDDLKLTKPEDEQFILVNAKGEIMQGTAKQLLPILLGANPVFNNPINFRQHPLCVFTA